MRRQATFYPHGRRVLGVTLGLSLMAAACAAPEAQPAAPAVDLAAVTAEVDATVDRFFELADQRDWTAAGDLMGEEFAIYTDGATVIPKAEYVELLSADDLVVESWELRDRETFVSPDGKLAWCRYRGLFRSTSHGENADVETAETLVLAKRDGEWKIVHAHASIAPLGGAEEGGGGEAAGEALH